ncbi:hypothetical protein CR970_03065 [Candidatus Saccharibacteria bacterium]|nr:MAG: hypothetical protein CR970_03065 [Candidatus Saccharibacteria bacterium]
MRTRLLRLWDYVSTAAYWRRVLVPVVVFAILAISLWWRAWSTGGYLFLLDMPWPNHFQLSDYTSRLTPDGAVAERVTLDWIWAAGFAAIGALVGQALIQKLLLSGVVAGAGLAMWLLSNTLYKRWLGGVSASSTWWPPYAAGFIYCFNPYVMDRLWAGQWRVVAGYGLVSVLLYLYVRTTDAVRRGIWLAVAAVVYALYPSLSVHWWVLCSALLAVVVGVHWYMRRPDWRVGARYAAIMAGVFVLINSWWLWHVLRQGVGHAGTVAADVGLFAMSPNLAGGPIGTALGLGGFWYGAFRMLPGMQYVWLGLTVAVLFLTIVGWRCVAAQARDRAIAYGVAAVGIAAMVLMVLAMSGWGVVLLQAAMGFFAPLQVLRDMSKVSGLLALGYALFAPVGLAVLLARSGWRRSAYRAVLIAAGALYVLAMLPAWTDAKYATPHDYPASWRAADDYLTEEAEAERVLVLPYVQYLRLPGNDRLLTANPANQFLRVPAVVGSSVANPVYDEQREPADRRVGHFVGGLTRGASTPQDMHDLNIDYLLVLDDINAVPADAVLQEAGFELAYQRDGVRVYR